MAKEPKGIIKSKATLITPDYCVGLTAQQMDDIRRLLLVGVRHLNAGDRAIIHDEEDVKRCVEIAVDLEKILR